VTRSDQPANRNQGGAGPSNLTLRVVSAAVLVPLALVGTYLGGLIFLALCAVAAGGILWEWTSVVAKRAEPRILLPGWTALLVGAMLVALNLPNGAWGVLALGALSVGLVVRVWPRGEGIPAPIWAAGGVAYAGAGFLGPALLRQDPQWGFTALLFLFATVWITDIFAFSCGHVFGGPRLWPSISPNKTWSGAIGGLAGGVAAGVAVAYASSISKLGMIGVMAFVLSVLAQAGDLFESAVKRRFGVKDASHLIPGHGGLMDRLDGFLFAAFAALLIGILHQGTTAPARGLLVW